MTTDPHLTSTSSTRPHRTPGAGTPPAVTGADPVPADLPPALRQARYARLRTFRRDGSPVDCPVWFAASPDGSTVWFRSKTDTAKVRRLRRDPRVELTPADWRGRVTHPVRRPWWAGRASWPRGRGGRASRGPAARPLRLALAHPSPVPPAVHPHHPRRRGPARQAAAHPGPRPAAGLHVRRRRSLSALPVGGRLAGSGSEELDELLAPHLGRTGAREIVDRHPAREGPCSGPGGRWPTTRGRARRGPRPRPGAPPPRAPRPCDRRAGRPPRPRAPPDGARGPPAPPARTPSSRRA